MPNVTLLMPRMRHIDYNSLAKLKNQMPDLSNLSLMLSRASYHSCGLNTYEAVLAKLFDLDADNQMPSGIAPYTYFLDSGIADQGWCMRADPVFLMPDRDQLVLSDPCKITMDLHEAQSIATHINNVYKDELWEIQVLHPLRWYWVSQQDPQIKTHALYNVIGKNIDQLLPTGPEQRYWRMIMNEMQMLLHSYKTDFQRDPPDQQWLNSLWFWGEGKILNSHNDHYINAKNNVKWEHVLCDDILCRSIATYYAIANQPLTKSAIDWLSNRDSSTNTLIVFEDQQRFSDHTLTQWIEWLDHWDEQWLYPLLLAVKNREIKTLTLYSSNGHCYSVNKANLRKWWKPKRPWYNFPI